MDLTKVRKARVTFTVEVPWEWESDPPTHRDFSMLGKVMDAVKDAVNVEKPGTSVSRGPWEIVEPREV